MSARALPLALGPLALGLLALGLAASLTSPRTAAAQPGPALHLVVHVGADRLAAGALRERLSAEIGQPVVRGEAGHVPRLEVSIRGAVLHLAYVNPEGGELHRETPAPENPRELLLVTALLGASIVRDDSSALLDALAPPGDAPAADAPAGDAPIGDAPIGDAPSGDARAGDAPAGEGLDDRERPRAEVEAEAASDDGPADPSGDRAPDAAELRPPTDPDAERARQTPPDAREPPEVDRPYEAFGFDLLPGLGTSSVYGGFERRGLSFGILGDLYGALDGYSLGLMTSFGGDVRGVQQSIGVAAAERVRGVQLGFINLATQGVDGAQIGAVNVSGGRVRGAQVGMVNIGEDADVGVGVLNFYSRGQTHLELVGDSSGLFRFAVKHGAGWWHTIYSIGFNPFFGETALAAGLGMGARLDLAEIAFLELEAVAHYVVDTRFIWGLTFLTTVQVLAGIRPVDEFAVVFGFGLNALNTNDMDAPVYTPWGDVSLGGGAYLWPSAILGIQVL